jgi:hypothetical protein
LANIYFHNRSGIKIEIEQIETLIKESNLPTGRVALVFSDTSFPDDMQGACTPKMLLQFSPSYGPICCGNDSWNWDVCIALSKRACSRRGEFPAYFSYLIGHELGHASICLSDPALHIHYCLIQEHIKSASKNIISMWHELPHECRFDQFGLYLSERLWTRDRLNDEIETLLNQRDCRDRDRLQMMHSLTPRADLNQIREDLVKFSLPYKEALIASWEKDCREWGSNSLASLVVDYEELFK